MAVFSNWSLASERECIEAKSQLFNVQNERRSDGGDRSRLSSRRGPRVVIAEKRQGCRPEVILT